MFGQNNRDIRQHCFGERTYYVFWASDGDLSLLNTSMAAGVEDVMFVADMKCWWIADTVLSGFIEKNDPTLSLSFSPSVPGASQRIYEMEG